MAGKNNEFDWECDPYYQHELDSLEDWIEEYDTVERTSGSDTKEDNSIDSGEPST